MASLEGSGFVVVFSLEDIFLLAILRAVCPFCCTEKSVIKTTATKKTNPASYEMLINNYY